VLKVYNVYKDQDTGHVRIVMELIKGNCLEDMWDKFDVSQKKIVTEQAHDFFSQLRQIKGSFIGCIDGTACEDQLSLANWGLWSL
jgi:hypothetical protein